MRATILAYAIMLTKTRSFMTRFSENTQHMYCTDDFVPLMSSHIVCQLEGARMNYLKLNK